mmetsp:Transcript_15220/g.23679  ORF Transcript_15220/g.23679 Transcript_15220/m.23679 type:complete len:212 (+) Transcript_15220:631-1266(+)
MDCHIFQHSLAVALKAFAKFCFIIFICIVMKESYVNLLLRLCCKVTSPAKVGADIFVETHENLDIFLQSLISHVLELYHRRCTWFFQENGIATNIKASIQELGVVGRTGTDNTQPKFTLTRRGNFLYGLIERNLLLFQFLSPCMKLLVSRSILGSLLHVPWLHYVLQLCRRTAAFQKLRRVVPAHATEGATTPCENYRCLCHLCLEYLSVF